MHRFPRLSAPLALLMLGSLATLIACAPQTQTAGIELAPVTPAAPAPATACTAFARITFSRQHDTDETIRQVKAYDAARDAICGVGK